MEPVNWAPVEAQKTELHTFTPAGGSISGNQQVNQLRNAMLGFKGMPKSCVGMDDVVIAPTFPDSADDPRSGQIGHNLLNGSLGDADQIGDVTQAHLRIPGQAKENV